MSFLAFFQTNCVNVPLAIICTPKWISVGKFIAFNESYTCLARFIPCCRASFNFLFPKSMSIQRRVYSCRYSTFSVILLNFKVLYLELQSEDHPKFCIWQKYNYSFDWYIILLSLGKNWHQKIFWMWSKMAVIRGLHVFYFL